ncbi:MAG: hypothetical protein KA449_01170 [Pelolinea sp.]|nr:hypothetical protein [Pelolinea sp.]
MAEHCRVELNLDDNQQIIFRGIYALINLICISASIGILSKRVAKQSDDAMSRVLKKTYYLGVLDNLHMKIAIAIYKSRFSLTQNVFFNNLLEFKS